MRTIRIEGIEYKVYAKIRQVLFKTVPFAIINNDYDPEGKVCIVNFWDSDYIPDELKKYILQPPLSRENKEELSKGLSDLADEIDLSIEENK